MKRVAIIDYGAGNLQSLKFALDRLDAEVVITSDTKVIQKADKLIFPGVGHATTAMNSLRKTGLDLLIPTLSQDTLGICLGMQLMCSSTEEGNQKGLDIFPTKVKKFKHQLKIPHMGWNNIMAHKGELFKNISTDAHFYCVHSYYVENNRCTTAKMEYGLSFSASLQKDNFFACQFHPEKSGEVGALFLQNFIEL
jgi:glutamine amidotransferase